eukprot:s1474_g10.t1
MTFCFDDAPKIEFDGTDNIPSNADDLLSIVQGGPNALAVTVSKRDQQKLRSWAKTAGLFLHVPGVTSGHRAGDTQRVLFDWTSYLASFDAQITVVPATFQSADHAIHRDVLHEGPPFFGADQRSHVSRLAWHGLRDLQRHRLSGDAPGSAKKRLEDGNGV